MIIYEVLMLSFAMFTFPSHVRTYVPLPQTLYVQYVTIILYCYHTVLRKLNDLACEKYFQSPCSNEGTLMHLLR